MARRFVPKILENPQLFGLRGKNLSEYTFLVCQSDILFKTEEVY